MSVKTPEMCLIVVVRITTLCNNAQRVTKNTSLMHVEKEDTNPLVAKNLFYSPSLGEAISKLSKIKTALLQRT